MKKFLAILCIFGIFVQTVLYMAPKSSEGISMLAVPEDDEEYSNLDGVIWG